jgi:hypothetical protein
MTSNDDAARTLGRLTVAKRMQVATDGRLEIALAIAGTTQKVKVDPTKHPFETTPDDLFDRTFNDEQVGIDDTQMEVFKANLTLLLPEIKSDIAQIPDNASLKIDQVAQFIELALQAAGGEK